MPGVGYCSTLHNKLQVLIDSKEYNIKKGYLPVIPQHPKVIWSKLLLVQG